KGKIVGARGLANAESLLKTSPIPGCLLCGVDTFLNAATLNYYREQNRLLTGKNSNGFIPGEAAAVVLIERNYNTALKRLRCVGIGEGKEEAFLGSGKPLRADGLVQALRNAEKDSGRTIADTDYRITDVSGEHFFFKESTLLV